MTDEARQDDGRAPAARARPEAPSPPPELCRACGLPLGRARPAGAEDAAEYVSLLCAPSGSVFVAQNLLVWPVLVAGIFVVAMGIFKLLETFRWWSFLFLPVVPFVVSAWFRSCSRYGSLRTRITFDPVTGTVWRQLTAFDGKWATRTRAWLTAEQIVEVHWHRSCSETARAEKICLALTDGTRAEVPDPQDHPGSLDALADRIAAFARARVRVVEGGDAPPMDEGIRFAEAPPAKQDRVVRITDDDG